MGINFSPILPVDPSLVPGVLLIAGVVFAVWIWKQQSSPPKTSSSSPSPASTPAQAGDNSHPDLPVLKQILDDLDQRKQADRKSEMLDRIVSLKNAGGGK